MMQNNDQQLKVNSDEPKQNENNGKQHKIPQLKVITGIRSGEFCSLTNRCGEWECC